MAVDQVRESLVAGLEQTFPAKLGLDKLVLERQLKQLMIQKKYQLMFLMEQEVQQNILREVQKVKQLAWKVGIQ